MESVASVASTASGMFEIPGRKMIGTKPVLKGVLVHYVQFAAF